MATNTLKRSKSFNVGKQSEEKFVKAARQENFIVRKASREQNMYKHVDFFLEHDRFKFSVDVKARKKASRSDATFDDVWNWIEFKNVRGNPGWLYGEADYIALEREKDFILASREELKNFCEERVDQDDRVSSAYEAKYKCYQRAGNKDLITRIRMEDINNFKRNMIFEKITVDS